MGAILEIYSVDDAQMRSALADPPAYVDDELVGHAQAVSGAKDKQDIDTVRLSLVRALGATDDSAAHQLALVALLRRYGTLVDDVSVNSSVIGEIARWMQLTPLAPLAESQHDAPAVMLLTSPEVEPLVRQLELQPEPLALSLIDAIVNAAEEVSWQGQAMALLFW